MKSVRAVHIEKRDHIRLLRLDHGPNALDDELLSGLDETLASLEGAGAPAVVLASAHPTIFCPGLDLKKLDGRLRGEVGDLMRRFNALLCRIASYPGPTVAALTGHAIAGGCLLALACDRRVMTRSRARIGLSEINLGIPVPAGAVAMLLALYPTRSVEQLVLEGDGFGGERALELGLVERLADSEGVVDEAVRVALHLASRPAAAYAAAKGFLRQGVIRSMEEREAAESEHFLDRWFDPDTQDRIGAMIAAM